MQRVIDAFIPHEGNDYQPHAVRGKRARQYAGAFVAMKLIVVIAILTAPSSLFMSERSFAALEADLIARTNAERVAHGHAAVAPDVQLEQAATSRAVDLGTFGYFSHVGPNGQEFRDFLAAARYPFAAAGENLAMGFSDAQAITEAWMASPTHRANILADDYVDIGVGAARGTFGGRPVVYIAQHLGRRSDTVAAAPVASFLDRERSVADWAAVPGGTMITVTASSHVFVESMTAQAYDAMIPLVVRDDGAYVGSALLSRSPNELFRVQLLPVITARIGGTEHMEPVAWSSVYVPRQSLRERFAAGSSALTAVRPELFRAARIVFGIGLIAFAIVLIASIVTQTHRRHPHIFGRAAVLVILLAFLIAL
ncbi:MAG: CAP domain-containing protein [bacterium]|nr:CAP domain-containing protein [bacterium]